MTMRLITLTSKFLLSILNKYPVKFGCSIKNSIELTQKLAHIKIRSGYMMCSFDMKNMYTVHQHSCKLSNQKHEKTPSEMHCFHRGNRTGQHDCQIMQESKLLSFQRLFFQTMYCSTDLLKNFTLFGKRLAKWKKMGSCVLCFQSFG